MIGLKHVFNFSFAAISFTKFKLQILFSLQVNKLRESEDFNFNYRGESSILSFKIDYEVCIYILGKKKRFYGWSALHIACYFNQIEVLTFLLKKV